MLRLWDEPFFRGVVAGFVTFTVIGVAFLIILAIQ